MTPWRATMVLGALLALAYELLPRGTAADLVYVVTALGGSAAILLGVAVNRPASRAPWVLFAAGSTTWAAGDALVAFAPGVAPLGSLADVPYLAAYPMLIAGAVLLIRRRGPRLDLPGFIDSAIVLVALGVMSWTWIAGPAFTAAGVSLADRAIALAYPAGDIVLMAFLVRLLATPGRPSTASRLLVGAVTLQILADTAVAGAQAPSDSFARWLDLLWLGSYVLWGAAALHPSMTGLSERVVTRRYSATRRRTLILAVATLLTPATFVAGHVLDRPVQPAVLVGAATVLSTLALTRMVCAVGEITTGAAHRDRLQDELLHRSSHDALTDLYNRACVLRLTEAALARGHRSGTPTGLVMVDLDRFAALTEDWGNDATDAVLVECARRVASAAGPFHAVGRVGDDRFVVLVEGADAEEQTTEVASRLVTVLGAAHDLGDRAVEVAARVGLSVSLDSGTDAAELMREAQIANRRAVGSARGTFEVFDTDARRELVRRSAIEDGLRRALREGELELVYQPVVGVDSGVVRGYEALVRWNHPDGVARHPDDFIPIAERTDLICDIGRWTLREAVRQLEEWIADDPARFARQTVAVNICGRHLARPEIVDDVVGALRSAGLDARHLVVEVTETVLIDVPHAVVQLERLRAAGVGTSLDDFGTGYTSIRQLRDLPVDTIKIDRSFLTSAPQTPELIELMTAAAHSCGMQVVAEGVERADQLELLRALACDAAQGYLFDAPLPARAVLGREGVGSVAGEPT